MNVAYTVTVWQNLDTYIISTWVCVERPRQKKPRFSSTKQHLEAKLNKFYFKRSAKEDLLYN